MILTKRRGVTLLMSMFLGIVLYMSTISLLYAAVPCDAPANPIVAENCMAGSPRTEWDIPIEGAPSIEGYATDISYNKGEVAQFKIKSPATSYRIDIYRMGYYGGTGARKVATISPSVTLPQVQPACTTDTSVGLVDCGNWAVSASWQIPSNAVSGVYFAKLVRTDPENGSSNHIFFIVRDDTSTAPILFQTSDTTWQAYNQYGGWSLYFSPAGSTLSRAYKVSYNRPFQMFDAAMPAFRPFGGIFAGEYNMIRFLEKNGFNVSYFTDTDSDRRGTNIRNHKLFISAGHDEYWSGAHRANVEAAANAGVHLAFFTANEVYWKTRFENNYRTLVTYKDMGAAKNDPVSGVWTGMWRDLKGAAYDAGRPENGLTGTIYAACCSQFDPFTVPEADGKMRFWRNTNVATLAPGQTATFPTGLLGWEWDEDRDNGFRPAGLIHLSTTNVTLNYDATLGKNGYITDSVANTTNTVGSGLGTHHLTLYKRPSGAYVFGAGTINIAYALDNEGRDATPGLLDTRLQQAVINLFADMGIQPATLQADLVAATKTTDTRAPVSTFTSPLSGATLVQNNTITIAGSTTDVGGKVAGVEISVDNGVTWHPAVGRASWSYNWTPTSAGSYTIKVRAVDDSGNLEVAKSRTVTVSPATGHTILIYAAGTPAGSTFPMMELVIGGQSVKTFTNIRGNFARNEFETYGYTQAAPIPQNQIEVRFINDYHQDVHNDINLYVEKIVIDGTAYPTVAPTTYSTGTLNPATGTCVPGFATSNKLACNGSFLYNYQIPPRKPDTPGVVIGSMWYMRNSNTTGYGELGLEFNYPGVALACDWDGDGIDTPGYYDRGRWYIRNSLTSDASNDITFLYGDSTWKPLCGDWNGDGVDTPAAVKSGIFALRNANSTGEADIVFIYGNPNDPAIAGDWNGDGIDTVGIIQQDTNWYLRNTNLTTVVNTDAAWIVFPYTGVPIVGDWNGDGMDTPGYVSSGGWYLKNSATTTTADVQFIYGNPGNPAYVGKWTR